MNTHVRTGKIARLPHAVRENLNQRLLDNEPGVTLVAWLNTLPEVQASLACRFGGRLITKQNLSEWRGGGFRDWQLQRELHALIRAAATAPLSPPSNPVQPAHEIPPVPVRPNPTSPSC